MKKLLLGLTVLVQSLTACGEIQLQENTMTQEFDVISVSNPNHAAHIKNRGKVAEYDGWIYYINSEQDLCKMKENGSEKTVLVQRKENTSHLKYINIADDSLYYCEVIITDTEYVLNVEFETIYKISLDGTNQTEIFSTFDIFILHGVNIDSFSNMTVVDDWIYFTAQNGLGITDVITTAENILKLYE
jgi:hypothetical protein